MPWQRNINLKSALYPINGQVGSGNKQKNKGLCKHNNILYFKYSFPARIRHVDEMNFYNQLWSYAVDSCLIDGDTKFCSLTYYFHSMSRKLFTSIAIKQFVVTWQSYGKWTLRGGLMHILLFVQAGKRP